MSTRSEAAWSDFWGAGGAGPESGCLPKALQRIDAVQRRVWAQAATPLRPRARVLDLATGDGAVLGKIRAHRSDLKLIGVDSAERLPPGPRGVTLKPRVPMEALPFAGGSFDLVTSQFGFEYGDQPAIAREIARVLVQGGQYCLVVHHADGPIVAHNRARRGGLGWAVEGSGLLTQAKALAQARQSVALPTPQRFATAPLEARQRFPGQAVAEEFVTAILQTLELGRGHPGVAQLAALDDLERRGRNEMARIDALQAAACSAEDIDAIIDLFEAEGLQAQAPHLLRETDSHPPFAWRLTGRLL
jgi:SAM-dependent methyltransferase